MKNKNAIGPVIAVALLIVVAVSAVVGFQTFFNSYQSSIQSKVETKSNTNTLDITYIETYIDKTIIYVKNDANDYSIINQIKLNKNICNLIGSDVIGEKNITKVSIDCLINKNTKAEIMINTDFGLYQKTLFAK